MRRRKFLIGAGSLAAGSAAAMGTGAFTQVSANRDMTISVAGDSAARLKITPAAKGNDISTEAGAELTDNAKEYVTTENDGTISLDFSGLNKDAETIIDGLLDFTNQGTQPINVGETNPSNYPGSFYAEGEFGDGDGDSFDVDDFDNSGQVVSTDIGVGETVQNVGYIVTDPEDKIPPRGNKTFEVTFQATRVGGDRV